MPGHADDRTAVRKSLDEKIASEPKRARLDLPAGARAEPVEILVPRRPVAVTSSRLRIFISYSGKRSRVLAFKVHELLATFLPRIQVAIYGPESGSRHLEILGSELELLSFGIFCLTPENLYSPWIHFEAGAISKLRSQAVAVPLLFDVRPSSLPPPLNQFGARVADSNGITTMLQDIAGAFGQDLADHDSIMKWWRSNVEEIRITELAEPVSRVDDENPLHSRMRSFCWTIQNNSTNFRNYLGREILTRVHDSLKEIAEQLTPIRTAEEFVQRVGRALKDGVRAQALCGGKPWSPKLQGHYYDQCYDFAEKLADRARKKKSPVPKSMTRVFLRTDKWQKLLPVVREHHAKRKSGVVPLIVTRDSDGRIPQVPELIDDIINRGFGFIIVRQPGQRVAFAHRGGGEGERFRAGEFRTEYALLEIERLFSILRQTAEPFDPKRHK